MIDVTNAKAAFSFAVIVAVGRRSASCSHKTTIFYSHTILKFHFYVYA